MHFYLGVFHVSILGLKGFSARFMTRCLGHYNQNNDEEVTVFLATSGDTGAAVAHDFIGIKGVKIVILYPNGRVSDIQGIYKNNFLVLQKKFSSYWFSDEQARKLC